jgi:methionyl-tRNA formyltransferase
MPHSIIFCGTPDVAAASLEVVIADPRFHVTLVITRPDAPQGRKQILTPPPVKTVAERAGLPVFQPLRFNSELPAFMKARGIERPDFLIVIAFGVILDDASLALPKIAPINIHYSLLPRWRGASPVEHAILAGDSETGVTVQTMVRELDAGPLLAVRKIPIGPRDTSTSLRAALSRLGAELLVETLSNPLSPVPQPADGVTFCSKLTKDDGKADPAAMTAVEIDRRVRALNPWPGVTCEVDGQPLKLLETALEPTDDSIPLPCADGTTLHLAAVQPAGKKPMSGGAWKRGRAG